MSRSQTSWPRIVRKLIGIKAARAHYDSIVLLPKKTLGASANQLQSEIEKGEEEGMQEHEKRLMAICSAVGLADEADTTVKKIKTSMPRVTALSNLLVEQFDGMSAAEMTIAQGGKVRDGYVRKQLEVCLDGYWETLFSDEAPVTAEALGLPSEWLRACSPRNQ